MNKFARIAGPVVAGVGVILLVLNVVLGGRVNISLPLVFLMLGVAFILLVFVFSDQWSWAVFLFIPAGVLLALGMVFLLNVITGDWNAWAYAWLLLVTGAGAGLALAARYAGWQSHWFLIGSGSGLVGLTFFALFGAIAGGPVIQIMAAVLLIMGGLALRWLRLDLLLPQGLKRFRKQAQPASDPTSETLNFPGELLIGQAKLVEPLSARELEVLKMIGQGLTNQEIANRMVVAQSTVKTHINNIYGKLGVQTRVQAVKKAQELGIK